MRSELLMTGRGSEEPSGRRRGFLPRTAPPSADASPEIPAKEKKLEPAERGRNAAKVHSFPETMSE